MTVTKIETVTKTKYRIYLDGQITFLLYKGELSRYCLGEGVQITREQYQEILDSILVKRAKLRAMHLLNTMGRTEQQLRDKLQAGEYPPEVIDKAVDYVKSFGYINDLEYARNFILGRKSRKSRTELYHLLLAKGLEKDDIEQALDECYPAEDAQAAIRIFLRKKGYDPGAVNPETTRKIMGALMRKGFRYEDIRQVIQVSEWNA